MSAQATSMQTGPLIYRQKDVLGKLGISKSTLRRWMEDMAFPRPRQLGPRAVGWLAAEVHRWLDDRPSAKAEDSNP